MLLKSDVIDRYKDVEIRNLNSTQEEILKHSLFTSLLNTIVYMCTFGFTVSRHVVL